MESFIRFNVAGQLGECAVLHGQANTMEHEPCGFLSHLKVAGDLVGTDSVLAVDDQPRGREPLLKGDRGVLEDGSGLERKSRFFMLGIAFPNARFFKPRNLLSAATGAGYNPIRPAQFHHKLAAVLELRKVDDGFLKAVGCAFHELSMRSIAWYVKYIITP
jgi:hypothetical protein